MFSSDTESRVKTIILLNINCPELNKPKASVAKEPKLLSGDRNHKKKKKLACVVFIRRYISIPFGTFSFLSFSDPDSQPLSPFSPALTKTRSTSSPPALRSAPSSSRDPCSSTPAPSRRTRRKRKHRPAPADHAPSPNTITCPLRSPPARAQTTPRKRWPSLPPSSRRRPRNRPRSLRTSKSAKARRAGLRRAPRHTRFAHPKLPLLSDGPHLCAESLLSAWHRNCGPNENSKCKCSRRV